MKRIRIIVGIAAVVTVVLLGAVVAVRAFDNRIAPSADRILTRYEDSGGSPYWKITPSAANAYLLPVSGGYLMIDTGYPEDSQLVYQALSREGIELSEIRYLFITHAHDEHAGFAADLKARSGCRLILPEGSLADLARGRFDWQGESVNRRVDLLSRLYNLIKQRDFSFEPVVPGVGDIILKGEMAPLPADWQLEGSFLHTPGHSADSWSLVLSDGRAFVGDAAMNTLSVLGPAKRPIFMEDRKEVYESFERIRRAGALQLFTGHGQPFWTEELPVLAGMEKTGVSMSNILAYLARVAFGLFLITSFLLITGRRDRLLRIFCYILAFILMRDLMTPYGLWTLYSEPVFGLRFAPDAGLLILLALGSLSLSLAILLSEKGLPELVPLFAGSRLTAVATGLLGAGLIVLPLLFSYTGILPAERGGTAPGELIPLILLFAICGNLLEELLFRGYLIHWFLSKGLGSRRSAIASGLFFAVCHLFLAYTVSSTGYPLLLFVLWEGIICGLLAVRFGLISAVVAHGLAIGILAII